MKSDEEDFFLTKKISKEWTRGQRKGGIYANAEQCCEFERVRVKERRQNY